MTQGERRREKRIEAFRIDEDTMLHAPPWVFGRTGEGVYGLVADFHRTGARILLSREHPLPDGIVAMRLMNDEDYGIRELRLMARVVWTEDAPAASHVQVGCEFVETTGDHAEVMDAVACLFLDGKPRTPCIRCQLLEHGTDLH